MKMDVMAIIEEKDNDIMLRVKNGDSEAFSILFERYYSKVAGLCWRYTQDKEIAEDAAQEIFLKIYHKAQSYKPTATFSTYIYTVTVNHCLNTIRDRKRRVEVSLDDGWNKDTEEEGGVPMDYIPSQTPSPRDIALSKEITSQVRQAIAQLPKKQRLALMLKKFDNLSYEEIGKTMNCSEGAVDSLLQRARLTLSKKLKKIFSGGII